MAIEKYQFDDEHHDHRDDPEQYVKFEIELSPEMRKRIKQAARKSGMPVRKYLEQILEQFVPEDVGRTQRQGRTITPEVLAHVFEVHEQIKQHTNGRIFEDSTELLRQIREERSQELEQR